MTDTVTLYAPRITYRHVPMPNGQRVPVVRDDACRYCRRYRNACGRHEMNGNAR